MAVSRGKWIGGLAAAVVLVAGGGLGGALWANSRDSSAPAPSESGAATSAPPTSATSAESSCGLTGTLGQSMDAPIPATWENVAGWKLPISKSDGPAKRDPVGSWSCYAHTPAGAVLAGYVISMRADGVAEDWQTVTKQQTIPGAGQQAHLQSVPSQSDPVQARGFTVAAYSDDRSTVNYYLQAGDSQVSCTTNVVWSAGDWKLQLGDDGSTSTGCVVGVPATFTPWGPS